ncbi:MAG TPA: aminotransferase class V-fold PLP-dependent enzyme, partial [Actinomycetota bacterium]|nr:aminotransferase class V-fold PLP-dependent enzyme [Actinomycetota bacterium]
AAEVAAQGEVLRSVRDRLEHMIVGTIPDVFVNGGDGPRVPGTLSVCIRGVEGESLLLMLDSLGIAASSGSACASGSLEPSHVLMAMGVAPELAHGSLRLSLGRGSGDVEVARVVESLAQVVGRLRSIAPRFAKTAS